MTQSEMGAPDCRSLPGRGIVPLPVSGFSTPPLKEGQGSSLSASLR